MSTIEKALQKNKKQKAENRDKSLIEAAREKAQVMTQPNEAEEAVTAESPSITNDNLRESDGDATVSLDTNLASSSTENSRFDISSSISITDSDDNISKEKFIPLTHIQKDGFVSNMGRNTINEEYRAIKRKVLSNAFGPLSKTLTNANIVMVTSPNPNEGKTFTAINLALSIALEQDKTVLLVDADVLRPSVMKTIDQPFESGLMEYLLGEVDDLSDVIHHTSLDTLRIIPAGKSHHLSTELLASEKMLESVSEFANRYPDRVVIIDSPPLLGINETAILANLAGQAVVVVQEGKTSLNRLSQAVEHLNPDMAKGFIINKAKKSGTDGAGYYGYYYGNDE
ncbi:XrtA-associated tyrosine autokinase [Aliiglaciecola sp. 2_MG-2023]|uniref:XrtA-associated tyrosine autokinase n=1 Tax=unclassified Aliiglaciecola TaxID=2593648 RepID=UPI0026E24159|nr:MULTISPECIES: XrtA-associated tyrosine autokinase [unclassified Aliiglaciecola]MDO6709172.1 XrtA-associated tyrosine autokinase [Aliiglaciecola sp. 2_MG-2023]MDO6750320.1 XrtA-associated tyrosine autokinase [Aliiglaciecola sp. 1_MG-2023]